MRETVIEINQAQTLADQTGIPHSVTNRGVVRGRAPDALEVCVPVNRQRWVLGYA